jgi:hypothetical protein
MDEEIILVYFNAAAQGREFVSGGSECSSTNTTATGQGMQKSI